THEEGIPSGRALDSLAKVMLELARDQAIHVPLRKGLESQRNRPLRMPFGELRPRKAKKEDRFAGREKGRVLDQVAKGLLCPLNVTEQAAQGCLLLEQLPERPRDLLRGGSLLCLSEERANRRSSRRI